jgi:hypothetical protein
MDKRGRGLFLKMIGTRRITITDIQRHANRRWRISKRDGWHCRVEIRPTGTTPHPRAFKVATSVTSFPKRAGRHRALACHTVPVMAALFFLVSGMLWRSSRGRPLNAPAAYIHPCQPIGARQPPTGPGWAHELKHDGYRLQIHVRDGRVRLYNC